MFHCSNDNWAIFSMHAVHILGKLKRWAFHMGHVIEHCIWMTNFLGLPWNCDYIILFVPQHHLCVAFTMHIFIVFVPWFLAQGDQLWMQPAVNLVRLMSPLFVNPFCTFDLFSNRPNVWLIFYFINVWSVQFFFVFWAKPWEIYIFNHCYIFTNDDQEKSWKLN